MSMWKQISLFNENDQKVVVEEEPGGDNVMQVHIQDNDVQGGDEVTLFLDVDEARELGKELIHFADELEGTRRTEINI